MKSVDVKSSTYINASEEINDEDPKFEIGDTVGTFYKKELQNKNQRV